MDQIKGVDAIMAAIEKSKTDKVALIKLLQKANSKLMGGK